MFIGFTLFSQLNMERLNKVTLPIAAPLFLIVHQQAFVDFRQPLQDFNFVYQATSFIFAGICMTLSSSQLVYRHV